MCLFQRELVEAQTFNQLARPIRPKHSTSVEEQLAEEQPAEQNTPVEERLTKELPADTWVAEEVAQSVQGVVVSTVSRCLQGAASGEGRATPRPTLATLVALLLVAFATSLVVWTTAKHLFREAATPACEGLVTSGMAAPPARLAVVSTLAEARANASVSTLATAAVTVPMFNTSATVRRLRDRGLAKLETSECWEADWYFGSALELLAAGNESWVNAVERDGLLGNRGFAMICMQKFQDGAALLEETLLSSPSLARGPPHLVNALGFAYFHLKDYVRAEATFEVGAKADPMNPIMWNNLAAAKMVQGRIQEADDALYHTMDRAYHGERASGHKQETQIFVGEYYQLLFQSNAFNLASRARGAEDPGLPIVELWWAQEATLSPSCAEPRCRF